MSLATRRANDLNAARDILVASLSKFPRDAIIYYNLACYDCQLGQIASAKQYLKQAFRIDPNWISQALEDEDLKPLWDSLQAMIGSGEVATTISPSDSRR
jgi:tetratricopeptide (TPR) repeat protein